MAEEENIHSHNEKTINSRKIIGYSYCAFGILLTLVSISSTIAYFLIKRYVSHHDEVAKAFEQSQIDTTILSMLGDLFPFLVFVLFALSLFAIYSSLLFLKEKEDSVKYLKIIAYIFIVFILFLDGVTILIFTNIDEIKHLITLVVTGAIVITIFYVALIVYSLKKLNEFK